MSDDRNPWEIPITYNEPEEPAADEPMGPDDAPEEEEVREVTYEPDPVADAWEPDGDENWGDEA